MAPIVDSIAVIQIVRSGSCRERVQGIGGRHEDERFAKRDQANVD